VTGAFVLRVLLPAVPLQPFKASDPIASVATKTSDLINRGFLIGLSSQPGAARHHIRWILAQFPGCSQHRFSCLGVDWTLRSSSATSSLEGRYFNFAQVAITCAVFLSVCVGLGGRVVANTQFSVMPRPATAPIQACRITDRVRCRGLSGSRPRDSAS
jgi:hypothetical protein